MKDNTSFLSLFSFLSKQRAPFIKTRGLTIVEILSVIAVIAILIGIAAPHFNGFRDQGNTTKALADLKTLQAAVESYHSNHQNTYPDNITTALTNAIPQMISAPLLDPFSPHGTDTYQYSKSGQFYSLSSAGPDRVNTTGAVDSSGNVPTSTNDLVVTNGTKTVLNMTTDANNCGTLGHTCANGQVCSGGVCTGGCTPQCDGKTCGDDGCSGSCGTCGDGQTCTDGTCGGSIADAGSCTNNLDCVSGACGGDPKICKAIGSGADGEACSEGGDGSDCQSGYCGFDDSHSRAVCRDGAIGRDCDNGLACQSGYCVNGQCSAQKGANGAGCGRDNISCQGGHCVDDTCTDGSNNSDCDTGADCQNHYCASNDGVCTDGSIGADCGLGADCQSMYCGQRHDDENHYTVCTDGSPGSDCMSGASCRSGHCTYSGGYYSGSCT